MWYETLAMWEKAVSVAQSPCQSGRVGSQETAPIRAAERAPHVWQRPQSNQHPTQLPFHGVPWANLGDTALAGAMLSQLLLYVAKYSCSLSVVIIECLSLWSLSPSLQSYLT